MDNNQNCCLDVCTCLKHRHAWLNTITNDENWCPYINKMCKWKLDKLDDYCTCKKSLWLGGCVKHCLYKQDYHCQSVLHISVKCNKLHRICLLQMTFKKWLQLGWEVLLHLSIYLVTKDQHLYSSLQNSLNFEMIIMVLENLDF